MILNAVWQGLKHILRCIKGPLGLKLTFEKCHHISNPVIGYVDADLADDE